MQSVESSKIPRLQEQLAETEKGIENMLNAVQQGILTDSTKDRLHKLEARKKELEISVLQEQIRKPLLTKEQIEFGIYKFRKLDLTTLEGRQRIIDGFVNAVYLYDKEIILTFNYKDGTKTISLDDINGSDLDCLAAPCRNSRLSSAQKLDKTEQIKQISPKRAIFYIFGNFCTPR